MTPRMPSEVDFGFQNGPKMESKIQNKNSPKTGPKTERPECSPQRSPEVAGGRRRSAEVRGLRVGGSGVTRGSEA